MAATSRAGRIREMLAASEAPLPISEIAERLGEERQPVEYTVLDLAKRGEVARAAPGKYRALSDEERAKVASTRQKARRGAERAEEIPARSAPPTNRAQLTQVGKMSDGRLLLEDGKGVLWVATPVSTGGAK